MSKAEKAEHRALETYPVLMCYNDFQMVEEDINKPLREIYQEGYHQAEKDLELTWEDIEAIDQIFTDVFKDGFDVITNNYYQEVLKRFKDLKNENQKL